MAINSDIVAMKYEKLAMGISYKMGVQDLKERFDSKGLLGFTNRNYEKFNCSH